MRPYDEMPLGDDDYADVALLVAGVREFPEDEFARELDARVARRFEPVAAPAARRTGRGRLPRWAAGPAVAVVAGAVAAVVVLSGGGATPANGGLALHSQPKAPARNASTSHVSGTSSGAANGGSRSGAAAVFGTATTPAATRSSGSQKKQPLGLASAGVPTHSSSDLQASSTATANTTGAGGTAGVAAPVALGAKQIQSAQVSLTTPNQHVDQVASEVFNVVSLEHGTVQSSHVTTATRGSGGGYASFSLSIPTSNLQDAMTQLSRLRYAAVSSRDDGSQNVSSQYKSDQRQLADAKALRSSLLKQLATAYTQTAIDSIKAQLKLADQQISQWQATLSSLQHRISYSNVTVQINAGGLPVVPVAKSGGFTIHRAGHDALRVLVVSAGIALIVLAVLVPVGLVAALLMWLWVWLRQRRREHALDAA